jgi:Bacterial transcriptional activator domain
LWRGDALGGARGEYVSLLALQERIALDIELARHAEVLPELVTLTLTLSHPLEEHWRQLHMLALYRAGRQADALQVYRDVHALLVSELGIEPGAQLRVLHGRILRADPDLDGPVPAPAQRLSRAPLSAGEDDGDAPATMLVGRGPSPGQGLLAGRLRAARACLCRPGCRAGVVCLRVGRGRAGLGRVVPAWPGWNREVDLAAAAG